MRPEVLSPRIEVSSKFQDRITQLTRVTRKKKKRIKQGLTFRSHALQTQRILSNPTPCLQM